MEGEKYVGNHYISLTGFSVESGSVSNSIHFHESGNPVGMDSEFLTVHIILRHKWRAMRSQTLNVTEAITILIIKT